jgi:hypothetical protein
VTVDRPGRRRIRPAMVKKPSSGRSSGVSREIVRRVLRARTWSPEPTALRAILRGGAILARPTPLPLRRAVRCMADFVVLLLVVDVSLKFVDTAHPFAAVLFTLASAAAALRQMTAWRAGVLRPRAAGRGGSAWAFIAVALWFAATYAASHQWFQGRVAPMPFAVQAVGAVCLILGIALPFLRIPQLTRSAFTLCPHAVGGVLLTGNPMLAILVGAWLAATCHTVWRTRTRPDLLQPHLSEPSVVVRCAA